MDEEVGTKPNAHSEASVFLLCVSIFADMNRNWVIYFYFLRHHVFISAEKNYAIKLAYGSKKTLPFYLCYKNSAYSKSKFSMAPNNNNESWELFYTKEMACRRVGKCMLANQHQSNRTAATGEWWLQAGWVEVESQKRYGCLQKLILDAIFTLSS